MARLYILFTSSGLVVMDVVQLGLVMMALTICSYNSVLQECLEDQGVIIIFEVFRTLMTNA